MQRKTGTNELCGCKLEDGAVLPIQNGKTALVLFVEMKSGSFGVT